MKMAHIRFVGINGFHHPMFKEDGLKNFYGSIDKLFSRGATEEEVLASIITDDLTFFGSTFESEPMGTVCNNLIIVPNK